jgi:phospholipase/carboxylesterase
LLAAATATSAAACASTPGGLFDIGVSPRSDGSARLTARPPAVAPGPAGQQPGLHALDLGPGPEVLLHVPPADGVPARLVLTLHGAGDDARGGLTPLLPLADAHRLLLLSPASHGRTWDVILGDWGPDVRRIDDALDRVLATYPLDPARRAVSGFSDGASYALSLGLANAGLFTDVIAFSPGFIAPAQRIGTPRVYLSHGRADAVLPIDRTTRRIVPRLRAADVPLEVREFDGPHTVPPEIAQDAVRWLVQ